MSAPLDLDAINEELAGAGCLRPRTAAKVLAEIVRLRAEVELLGRTVETCSDALTKRRADSVPRSALVQVRCSKSRHLPDEHVGCQPVYVIREDTDA